MNSNPYILYVGSAYPHKNIPIILKALQLLLPTIPDLRLMLVSSRSVFLDRIKHEATLLGVTKQVDFAGFKTDQELQNLYKSAIALVHPSKSEGFGLTGLEAMQAGCPVIAANTTSLPEIYGKAALFFDPEDVNELVLHIKTFFSDQTIRKTQIDLGLNQVKKYSWDKMVDQTLSVYKEITGRKKTAA